MPRFPKDKRESLSLCYQVLAEDLEVIINFLNITGISEQDKEIFEDVVSLAKQARTKSKKLSLKVVEDDSNIISIDFDKKDED